MIRALLLGLVLLLGAGCRESGSEGEYFAVSGRLFVFNYRLAFATYLVTLKPLRPLDESQTVVGVFEDPQGGSAIVVRQKVWAGLDKVTLQTPPLLCVRKDRAYAVRITVEDAGGKVVQTIQTTAVSSEDEASVLPDKPLTVGPGYTPNPDLAGNPGGRLAPGERPVCPAT